MIAFHNKFKRILKLNITFSGAYKTFLLKKFFVTLINKGFQSLIFEPINKNKFLNSFIIYAITKIF
tara:strand:- start:473 stop:670 length:198 start_codon:yes stop_codon:yes gene_type:complete